MYLGVLRKVKPLVFLLSAEMSEVLIHLVFVLVLIQIKNYTVIEKTSIAKIEFALHEL